MNKKQSVKMKAVLHILNSNEELKKKVLPHINFEHEIITWDEGVWKEDFSNGTSSAITWIYCLWVGEEAEINPIIGSRLMNYELRLAVLEALRIWMEIK